MALKRLMKNWVGCTNTVEKVYGWVKENIGQSVQSKKKEVLSIVKKSEQKWDQNTDVYVG